LEKRRKGYYGLPSGKSGIVFVDDLNMPLKEQYGAQPPIEIIRQVLDHKSWYNRKELIIENLLDLTFLTAMGPPGGGKTRITDRMVRHFNVLSYTETDDATITVIFNKIVAAYLATFNEEIVGKLEKTVNMVIDVYNVVKKKLKPTPAKSHYTFNLRDVSKVFQGICGASA
jgi:dynein heavy chain